MKRILLLGGAVSALTIGAAALAAGAGMPGGDAHRAERIDHIFEMFDANSDGAIDKAEVEGAHDARFAAMDTDGDGNVSAAEITAEATRRAEGHAARMLKRLDTDGDGQISRAEHEAMGASRHAGKAGRMFERFDADGDGRVTRAEAEAHMASHHKRWHDGG